MIESLWIPRNILGIVTLVLWVAREALVALFAMESPSRSNSGRQILVTIQTLGHHDSLSRRVTLGAVHETRKLGMDFGERSR